MLHRILCMLLLTCNLQTITAQTGNATATRYIKTPQGYLMVLRQDDSIISQLEALAVAEKIPSASFSGFGFAGFLRFGFFEAATGTYQPKDLENVEIASFTGTIAWEGDTPSIHAHGVAAGKDFKSYGGHMLSASVGTGSLEIVITVYEKKLQRKKDPTIDANVLQLE